MATPVTELLEGGHTLSRRTVLWNSAAVLQLRGLQRSSDKQHTNNRVHLLAQHACGSPSGILSQCYRLMPACK
jgi:hypothetical protein